VRASWSKFVVPAAVRAARLHHQHIEHRDAAQAATTTGISAAR
jgi:hypothetical protein